MGKSMIKRRKCCNCNQLTYKWQRINGSPWHCYDGCYSPTGWDNRTTNGKPLWLQNDAAEPNSSYINQDR